MVIFGRRMVISACAVSCTAGYGNQGAAVDQGNDERIANAGMSTLAQATGDCLSGSRVYDKSRDAKHNSATKPVSLPTGNISSMPQRKPKPSARKTGQPASVVRPAKMARSWFTAGHGRVRCYPPPKLTTAHVSHTIPKRPSPCPAQGQSATCPAQRPLLGRLAMVEITCLA